MIKKQDRWPPINFFNKQCARLQAEDIPIFMIAGNHDPLREQGELLVRPDNVTVFSGSRSGFISR